LLIAANVLTVEPGTLILIDEPERHLHRSITAPLLVQLFAKRSDCSFIISTHDVTLASDQMFSETLLVRDCRYEQSTVKAWDTDLVKGSYSLGDQVKIDILGSRRTILFIEGTQKSLDQQIYSVVFPGVSIVPKENCRSVSQSVYSIRESKDLHWIKAFGIIDGDNRPQEEVDRLKTDGVYAIKAYSVESIYYHPAIQSIMASRQVALIGGDKNKLLSSAKLALIAAVEPHIKRLGELTTERIIRQKFFEHIPNRDKIREGNRISIDINVGEVTKREIERVEALVASGDSDALITSYPIRETSALKEIAIKLGFQGRQQYEMAVVKMLGEDKVALEMVRAFFGTLFEEIFVK
jgi:hypothetical protein